MILLPLILTHCNVVPHPNIKFVATHPIYKPPGWSEVQWESNVSPKNTTQWPRPGLKNDPWWTIKTKRPPHLSPKTTAKKKQQQQDSDLEHCNRPLISHYLLPLNAQAKSSLLNSKQSPSIIKRKKWKLNCNKWNKGQVQPLTFHTLGVGLGRMDQEN